MNRAVAAGIAALALTGLVVVFVGPCVAAREPESSGFAATAMTTPSRDPAAPTKKLVRVRDATGAAAEDEIDDDGQRYELHVRVVAADTREPVAGASVEVDDRVVVAGGDGEASLGGLIRGTYWAWARARGFVSEIWQLSVPGGGEPQEVALVPGVTVAIEVVEAVTGRPLPNAHVTAALLRTGAVFHFDTDERGRIEAALPPQSEFRVIASAPRHLQAFEFVRTVARGESQSALTVPLARCGTVRGVVTDPGGRPVAETNVAACRAADRLWIADTETDAEGRYELGVPFGMTVRVVADSSGGAFARSALSREVTTTSTAPDAVVDLRLRRSARLELTVLDDEDEGRVAQRLDIRTKQEGSESSSSGAPGLWTEFVEPGPITVDIRLGGRMPFVETFELAEGQTLKRTIHLTCGATLSGIVVDESGEPVADTWIETTELAADEESKSFEKSGEDGRFVLELVPKGTHDIVVRPPYEFEETNVLGVFAPSDDARFVLRRRGTITFRAVFEDDAKPAPDSRIAFRGTLKGEEWRIDRILPRDRSFEEFWPPDVTGEVGIAVDGFVPVTRGIRVPAGAAVDLGEVRFRRAATLTGRLVGEGGAPLAKIVSFMVRDAWWGDSCKTGADGRFSFAGLAPGAVRIDVEEAPGCVFSADVPAAAPVEFVLPRLGSFTVVWRDAESQPCADRLMSVRDAGGVLLAEGLTSSLGDWTCKLAPGKFTVSADDVPSAEFEIRSSETTFVRLR